jgi:peptide/nickel transport system permease protein
VSAATDLTLDPNAERVDVPAGPTGQRFALMRFVIRRDPIACFLVGVFLIAAIFAPLLAPYPPSAIDLTSTVEAPTTEHLLGTDQFGRDLLSRILHAARVAGGAALMVVAVGAIVGTTLGTLAGGFGGLLDLVVSRVIEIVQGFPVILLAIAIVAITQPSLTNAMFAVGIAAIPDFARVARGITFQLRGREFVEAARSAGASELRILATEILPNMLGPLIVIASFLAAQAVMYESALSFLGLGVQPPTPSYGGMLSEAKGYLDQQPLFALFPGIAMAAVILGLNLLGDALSDYYDRGSQ